jgi:hypothetical protein
MKPPLPETVIPAKAGTQCFYKITSTSSYGLKSALQFTDNSTATNIADRLN